VFFFKPLNIREEDENTGEITTKTIPLLKTYNVFNISQTDLKIEDIKDTQLIPDVEEFIENVGVKIVQDDSAYYSPSRHYIGMPHKDTFRSTDAYYSTILHEIAHSSGNKNLLDRDMTGKFGSPEYAQEELIAETTKVFLETHLGLAHENSEHFEQSAAYLKGWLKPLADDPKQLWKIFSQAQKAFDYLLECQEKKEIAA
jgi:antirestriction protein ArdC